jgi:hypothetical protein
MDPKNDYWMANKGYLSLVAPNDIVITYDNHTARLSAAYFSTARIINLFPPYGVFVDEAKVLEQLDACTSDGGRILLDPGAWHPDRVTLITSRFFDAANAERFPLLLAEIANRYASYVYFVPAIVPVKDGTQPVLQSEDVVGARRWVIP